MTGRLTVCREKNMVLTLCRFFFYKVPRPSRHPLSKGAVLSLVAFWFAFFQIIFHFSRFWCPVLLVCFASLVSAPSAFGFCLLAWRFCFLPLCFYLFAFLGSKDDDTNKPGATLKTWWCSFQDLLYLKFPSFGIFKVFFSEDSKMLGWTNTWAMTPTFSTSQSFKLPS